MANHPSGILIVLVVATGCGGGGASPSQQLASEVERLHGPNFGRAKELYAAGKRAEAGAILRLLASDESWEVRARAVRAIGDAKDRSLLPQVHAALEDENLEVRESAGRVLTWLGNESSIPFLLKALSDPEPVIRTRAVETLARVGGAAQIETLTRVSLEDEDPGVRAVAAEALEQLRGSRNELAPVAP